MPIKIPDNLPARKTLEKEGVLVIREHDAIRQDVRPMRIALLNLMPEKIKTETQIARLVGSTPLQVEMTLLKVDSYTPTNTSSEHMLAFYEPWSKVTGQKFDGLIVTGAPVEEMSFEDVDYWPELSQIFDWARSNVFRTFNICWGAQAALFHYYGVPKHALAQKLSGVFKHRVTAPRSPLMRGFDDEFPVPVSRYTETRRGDIEKVSDLEILAESDDAGLCLIKDHGDGHLFMFNHLEYDTEILNNEYRRDIKAGREIHVPTNYFPNDNPNLSPANAWRSHGHMLFGNWINDVYQHTPFDVAEIGKKRDKKEESVA